MSTNPTGRPHNTTRLEDLHFMAATGESHTGAAERLGLRLDALEAWCRDNDRDVWTRLVANAHTPGNGARLGRITTAVR